MYFFTIFAESRQSGMKIISFKILREFYEREPKSETAIREWYKKAEKADWNNFSDLNKTFNSVDSVGNMRYVFNIKGHDCPLKIS